MSPYAIPAPICPIEGCARLIRGGGLCMTHYQRMVRNGGPLVLRGPRYVTCVLCGKSIVRQRRIVVNEANQHGGNGKRIANAHGSCWEKLLRAVQINQEAKSA
jgi:hypothetical protein